MINMAFMPLYMWEMWDVTPVTHEHTDGRTDEQWKVGQYSVWAESAITMQSIICLSSGEIHFKKYFACFCTCWHISIWNHLIVWSFLQYTPGNPFIHWRRPQWKCRMQARGTCEEKLNNPCGWTIVASPIMTSIILSNIIVIMIVAYHEITILRMNWGSHWKKTE